MSYTGPVSLLANGIPYIMSGPVLSLIKPQIDGYSLYALTDI